VAVEGDQNAACRGPFCIAPVFRLAHKRAREPLHLGAQRGDDASLSLGG